MIIICKANYVLILSILLRMGPMRFPLIYFLKTKCFGLETVLMLCTKLKTKAKQFI